ncbi:hypothetical protein [Burkholderia vietnamiensis]|uniref:hypothetical protein n=1 Tax=Burkholderia vietnamiensis TaxID=60552 RepID=UPI001CF43096|nr:hypothetical protein [Burkholderia vietnamiensis]MCA8448958.1 hypothetical protein [Burkholderia vietnamiensis]
MATPFETQDAATHNDNDVLQSQDFTAPSTKHTTLAKLRTFSVRKMNAYTNAMCGAPTDFIALTPRVTRSFDDRPRKPAEGPFIGMLEASMMRGGTFTVSGVDGYIVPKNTSTVSRLLFLREFVRAPWYEQDARVSGVDRNVEAIALTQQLLNEVVDADSTLHLSKLTGAPVDVVLTPRDYPRDANEARVPAITLVSDLFGEQSVRFMNVDQFRDHLEACKKRPSRKALRFCPTKLEHALANTVRGGAAKYDDQWTTAFPGDMDGILMSKDGAHYKAAAVLEWKSDTEGYPIELESRNKYSNDGTRFNVLDDVCKVLNVPLVLVFWSTKHTDAKVVFRNATTGMEETPAIVHAQSYDEAAQKVGALILAKVGGVPTAAPAPVVNASQAPRFKLFHATPSTPTVVRKPPVFVHAPANDRGASNVSAFPRGAGGSGAYQRVMNVTPRVA